MKRTLCLMAAASALAGCSSPPASIMNGPLAAMPNAQPAYMERVNNGSIYQASMNMAALYNGRRKPRFVGDSLKVDISESSSGSNTVKTATSRKNSLAAKGRARRPTTRG
ncbi:flagellar basal body L-ring protein FlgH [Xylophilus rhododendri]|uniref:flagellar basal body L-ring protein FlgH n=1 Tax=Xylophilus rhododendri TaxID=2697032 RepID=UPI002279F462|nr:flagellar basal body L-ring protein FlgH [Xylophilus rhododendri]